MTEHLHPYDPADALETPEALAAFLSDALDAQDTGHLIQALAVAARAKARQGDTSAAEAVTAALEGAGSRRAAAGHLPNRATSLGPDPDGCRVRGRARPGVSADALASRLKYSRGLCGKWSAFLMDRCSLSYHPAV